MDRQELAERRQLVEDLRFDEATPRIHSFIEGLEADEVAASVLREIRSVNIDKIISDCQGSRTQRPPQASTPSEIAAVGMLIIDASKRQNTEVFQISVALHIRASGTSQVQAYYDELVRRYLDPLHNYITKQLPAVEETDIARPIARNTKEVFIVHGRDEQLKETVARFLEKLELVPIILHEQADKGRTVIEKFEQCAEVGFAVVLLTPDDTGSLKDTPPHE